MNDTMTTDSRSHGTPPPPSPSSRPPLRRRTDGRMIAGVASGAARTLGVETSIVRILFVVTLFVGGLGIPLYLAGWLLIPEEGSDEAVVSDTVKGRGAQFWIGIVLLVIGVLALADQARVVTGDLAWPLVLIGIGIVLWRSSRGHGDDDPSRTQPPPPSSPPTWTPSSATGDTPAAGTDERNSGPRSGTADPAPSDPSNTSSAVIPATGPSGDSPPTPPAQTLSAPATARHEPAPRRKRSMLGRVTLGLALILVGLLWLGDQADLLELTFGDGVAATLGIVGLGLIVGAWLGRARWLIAVGLLLVPVVLVSSALRMTGVDLTAGVGDRFYLPGPVDELPEQYELAAGKLVLDLTQLELGVEPVEIVARVGAGQLEVIVPDDAAVDIDADVAMGEIDILGEGPKGAALDHSYRRTGERGPILLDLDVSFGQIVVKSRPGPGAGS